MRLIAAATACAGLWYSAAGMACPESSAQGDQVLEGLQAQCGQAGRSCTEFCRGETAKQYFACNETVLDTGNGNANCSSFQGLISGYCSLELGSALSEVCARNGYVDPVPIGSLSVTPAICNDSILSEIVLPDGTLTGESDVDCGGPWCNRCTTGSLCKSSTDCTLGHVCMGGVCLSMEDGTTDESYPYTAFATPILVLTLLGTSASAFYLEHAESSERLRRKQAEKDAAIREQQLQSQQMRRKKTRKDFKDSISSGGGVSISLQGLSATDAAEPVADDSAPTDGCDCSSLQELLAHDKTRLDFFHFCKSKFATENLLFWEAITDYEAKYLDPNVTASEMQLCGRGIVERFIADGCEAEVNLSHVLKMQITDIYKCSDPVGENLVFEMSTFSEAKEEIYSLMNTNFFAEFKSRRASTTSQRISPSQRNSFEITIA